MTIRGEMVTPHGPFSGGRGFTIPEVSDDPSVSGFRHSVKGAVDRVREFVLHVSPRLRFLLEDGRVRDRNFLHPDIKTGKLGKVATGTKGGSGNLAIWDANGDLADGGAPSVVVGGIRSAALSKTIASGAIDLALTGGVVRAMVEVDGEGAAADSLDTISGTRAGDEVILYSVSSGRVITVTEAGNISLGQFGVFSLTDPIDKLRLINVDGTNLHAESPGANN